MELVAYRPLTRGDIQKHISRWLCVWISSEQQSIGSKVLLIEPNGKFTRHPYPFILSFCRRRHIQELPRVLTQNVAFILYINNITTQVLCMCNMNYLKFENEK